jgi:hypothetical protein
VAGSSLTDVSGICDQAVASSSIPLSAPEVNAEATLESVASCPVISSPVRGASTSNQAGGDQAVTTLAPAEPVSASAPTTASAAADTQRPRTRLQQGIRKPKIYTDGTVKYGFLATSDEPHSVEDALHDKNWKEAMDDEYRALIQNKTWHLFLHKRAAILLIASGFIR